jgi:DNA-binding transcriptional ArsR family regulator
MTPADRCDVFRGMAHPLRRRVLRRLATGETPVSELLAMLKVRPATLSRHLAVLRETGLVTGRLVCGRQRNYRLCESKFKQARTWIMSASA